MLPGCVLIAGGKSFGGRMHFAGASHDAAGRRPRIGLSRLPAASGGQAVRLRARHLSDVNIPMLFIQGSRDKLAEVRLLLEAMVERLGASASLHIVREADHSFHVPARSGGTTATR